MKVEELRIGNVVILNRLNKEENIVIQEIRKTGIIHNDNPYVTPFEILKPIPLTEEWLIRLGFNKDYKQGYIGIDVCNTDFVLLTPENETASRPGKYRWSFSQDRVPLIKEVEFVHELQNLFFAISGKELIFKP